MKEHPYVKQLEDAIAGEDITLTNKANLDSIRLTIEKTPAFITEMLDDLMQMEVVFSPTDDMSDGDTIMGDVPENLRPLWALYRYYERERDRALVDLKYSNNDTERKPAAELHAQQFMRSQWTVLTFWGSVRRQLNLWAMPLAVRTGWKIITYKPETRPPLLIGLDLSGFLQ